MLKTLCGVIGFIVVCVIAFKLILIAAGIIASLFKFILVWLLIYLFIKYIWYKCMNPRRIRKYK